MGSVNDKPRCSAGHGMIMPGLEAAKLLALLKRIEWDPRGCCPECDGWMCSPDGCTPHKHTSECELKATINRLEKMQ